MATSWKLAVSVQHGQVCLQVQSGLPVQCWSMVRLAGAADFQIGVARSAFFQDLQLDLCADSAGQGVARSVLPQDSVGMLQPCQVTALLGRNWKLAVSVQHAAWAGQCSMVRVAADLQHLAVATSVQPRPAIGTLCRLVQLGSLWQ